jgi:hypothetical protein
MEFSKMNSLFAEATPVNIPQNMEPNEKLQSFRKTLSLTYTGLSKQNAQSN